MNSRRTKQEPGVGIKRYFGTRSVSSAGGTPETPATRKGRSQTSTAAVTLQTPSAPLKVAKQEKPDDVDLMMPSEQDEEDGGCYFVDQKGNYYYQASEDAEPVLTNLTAEPFDEDNGEGIKAEQDVSYVLIMDDGEHKSTIVADTQDANMEGDDDEIYTFEDQELPTDDTKANKQRRKKGGQSATGSTYMCNYCNYTSNKLFLLSRHLKSHSEDRPHKCSVCERGFKTLASLQNHVNTHTGTKPHRCKHCSTCFTTSGELVRHVRYRHTLERPHKCNECDYSSVELSKLKRHIRTHTGEKPFQCPHCTYASPDKFKLTRHLRIHTGEKPYSCDVCFARFTQSNSLKAHKMIHQVGDKPVYQCDLCPTTCGRKTDLRIHVQKLHTADKPIKCRRCDSMFADRYTYKIHAKTHDGEKCYKCDFCPYASISMRHLESHLLLHTDQKPFKCDTCSHSFRQKQLLKRHINLYHNPDYIQPEPLVKTHGCPSCPRRFRHKGNLMRHMSMHDPESAMHAELVALREGRQKKVQITLEEGTYYDEDDELEIEEEEDYEIETHEDGGKDQQPKNTPDQDATSDVYTVEEDDGQFVVLEVIQLQDKDKKSKKGTREETTAATTTTKLGRPRTKQRKVETTKMVAQKVKIKKESLDVRDNEDSLDGEQISLVLAPAGENDDDETEIVIERQDSDNEFELSSADLENAEMLMSSRGRFDIATINVNQRDIEKNMSNCFGFEDDEDDDDDDENMDQKPTMTLLN
ncbi:transcriptional repressor CTCFL-like [Anopheles cruzii]|uniref:transcriptional repressor CTCFL-like n=1 Tax=Anopheles cruzii TaxID=68878 RepID=UPI0022EC88B2|nr:transcriptional repressor CTCFL-like [Anopheles cruzii]